MIAEAGKGGMVALSGFSGLKSCCLPVSLPSRDAMSGELQPQGDKCLSLY